MNLIQKIKSYFIKYDFCTWQDFHWDKYELKFDSLNEEILLDIGSFIKHNLNSSDQIGNERHRLKEDKSIQCASLDQLLPLIKDIITKDYKVTFNESIRYNWDFRYFVSEHLQCENTICISNGLKSKSGSTGNCIYPLATIRKHNNTYFCWNHLQ
ncbi:MAG TPA: hypothetical protein VGB43_07080 [Flavobacterium sp.]